jgi:hypothetical protein
VYTPRTPGQRRALVDVVRFRAQRVEFGPERGE